MSRQYSASKLAEVNVNDKYEFIRKIGKGSYGEVWLVLPKNAPSSKSRSKQQVLKRLDLRQASNDASANDIEVAEREADLLSTLKHPNIVAYTESFPSNDGFLNIVMAYCEGGDLYTKLKERKPRRELLSENQIIEWFIQICMALQYIHERNILHRDLKTQNIFLTKNEIVKVGDLGIARVLDSARDLATTIIGTPYYMSPEILLSKPYGQKTDIWSLGCCVFEMMTFDHPFNAKDIPALIAKIISNEAPDIPKNYSQPLRSIVASLFKKNPDERPTAKSLLQNSYVKEHILRLLEKTKMKCHNQLNSNSQPVVNVSARPVTAASSSPSKARLSSAQYAPPVLPSYPVIPPSNSRPPSFAEVHRSTPPAEPVSSKEPSISGPRFRRQQSRSNKVPPINEQEKQLDYLSMLQQNDTLHRRRRDHQLSSHARQHHQEQQASASEQDASPARPPQSRVSQPPIVSVSPQKQTRASSVESHTESSRPPTQPRVTKSYDLNQGATPSARERRRQYKLQSSSTECVTPTESPSQTITSTRESSPPSIFDGSFNEEMEKKKEGEKDANDLVFMLTATLQLPSVHAAGANGSTDGNRPSMDYGDPHSKIWSSGERTIAAPLHETNRLHQRCNQIRQQCLQEISASKLKRLLKIIENVSEAQMTQEMIDELGEDLYDKYSAQIFALKFYEDALLIHS